jgi:hypothetical protein
MKRKLLEWGVIVLCAGILWMSLRVGRLVEQEPGSMPTIQEIQGLAELTTLKVTVADALVTEVRGTTGGIDVVLVVHGEARIGTDLSAAHFESINHENRTAVLVLPTPRIQSVRLDHARTRIVGIWPTGLWTIVPGSGSIDGIAVDRAFTQAEQVVAAAGDDPVLIRRAKLESECLLPAIFRSMGWRVVIRWNT